jgi:predicted PurR-regulated permease PerM
MLVNCDDAFLDNLKCETVLQQLRTYCWSLLLKYLLLFIIIIILTFFFYLYREIVQHIVHVDDE